MGVKLGGGAPVIQGRAGPERNGGGLLGGRGPAGGRGGSRLRGRCRDDDAAPGRGRKSRVRGQARGLGAWARQYAPRTSCVGSSARCTSARNRLARRSSSASPT